MPSMPGSNKLTSIRQAGASMVEFVIVAPVLLLMGLGTLQMGLIYHAKTTLNYATFEAARTGSVNHAQIEKMNHELGLRLAPVYGGDGSEGSAGQAIIRAGLDTLDPVFSKIEILNPTRAAFDAWGIVNAENGKLEIPNHHMRHQDPDDVRASVNLHDANLLKIKSTYGYQMQIPIAGELFAKTLMLMNPEYALFYAANRIPLTSVATLRMQNEAWLDGTASPAVAPSDQTQALAENPSNHAATPAQCDENGLGPLNQSLLDDDGRLNLAGSDMCEASSSNAQTGGAGQHITALSSQFEPCI